MKDGQLNLTLIGVTESIVVTEQGKVINKCLTIPAKYTIRQKSNTSKPVDLLHSAKWRPTLG